MVQTRVMRVAAKGVNRREGEGPVHPEKLRRKIMNRLALDTLRPLLYGAMGSGILLALLPFALVLGTNPAQTITPTITQSFSVPMQAPAKVCVAVNGEAKCSPVVGQVVTTTTIRI